MWRKTHKFGIIITKTVKESLSIDKTTGHTFWELIIQKEMADVIIAFEKGAHGMENMNYGNFLPGQQDIGSHIIFDINMDGNFTRKFRFVAGRHTNGPPAEITYSSVSSRDSVWLAFMIAELNDIDVFDAYIGYAYLNTSCREKTWTKAGPEFGIHQG